MPIIKAHHHGFTVGDVDDSLRFYRDLLGFELVRISERSNLPSYDQILGFKDVKIRVALLRHPVNEFILELFQYVNPPVQRRELKNFFVGSSHIAYEVDDIDEQYKLLRAAGYGSINPPVDVIRDGLKVARAMYALD